MPPGSGRSASSGALKRLPDRWPRSRPNKASRREQARVSTTDAEATVMKMADGGYRPAYNGQFASDTEASASWSAWKRCALARTWRN